MTNRFSRRSSFRAAALWAMLPIFVGVVGAQTALVSYKFKFGLATNPTPAGYIRVSPKNLYNPADTAIAGYYGFENWKQNRLGVVDRGGSDTLHRDFITNFDSTKLGVLYNNSPFYFSVNVPEGKYLVRVTMGDPQDTAVTTIQAESRRLLLKDFKTLPGQYVTKVFPVIRRAPLIAGSTKSVGLTALENPKICLDWDEKLSIQFNGKRPCISALEIDQVPNTTGTTIHVSGNSTAMDQEDDPWTCWGQMIPAFFDTNVFINDDATSGLTSSSFIAQGRLSKLCSMMHNGDYLTFEFGHNDSKTAGYRAAFQQNMQYFYDSAVAHGATMVFITPTARNGDNDSATSIDSAAFYTRQEAALLTGSKLIDLNAAVLHLNTAIPNELYCRIAANATLWPDQPATNDGTHFREYGGYELAKWVAYQGMRAAALPVRTNLYDTAGVFNSSAPLNPTATTTPDTLYTYVGTDTTWIWNVSCATDTVLRYASATICSTIVTPTAVRQASALPASVLANSIAVNALSGSVTFSAQEAGKARFIVYSLSGQRLMQKNALVTASQNSMQWEELGRLPQGTYFMVMEINNQSRAKTMFQRM